MNQFITPEHGNTVKKRKDISLKNFDNCFKLAPKKKVKKEVYQQKIKIELDNNVLTKYEKELQKN